MSSNLTTFGAALAMDAVDGPTYFVGLGTGQNPSGLVGEFSGGGYARVSGTFTRTGRTANNSAAVVFTGFTQSLGTATHLGLFDAATGGNCVWVGPLDAATPIQTGGTITLGAAAIALQIVEAA